VIPFHRFPSTHRKATTVTRKPKTEADKRIEADKRMDARMKAVGDWLLVHEGIRSDPDGSIWLCAFTAAFEGIALTYALDYLWWVATGERHHGMAERCVPTVEHMMQTRREFAQLGAHLPEHPPTTWQ
jgi:hypothetical protein